MGWMLHPIVSHYLGLKNHQGQAEKVAGSLGQIVQSFQVREAEGWVLDGRC